MSGSNSSSDDENLSDSSFFQRANRTRSRLQGQRLTVRDVINERFDRSSDVSPGDLPSVVDEGPDETDEGYDADPQSPGESPLGGTFDVSA